MQFTLFKVNRLNIILSHVGLHNVFKMTYNIQLNTKLDRLNCHVSK